jgi:hypothetical protein
MGHALGAPTLSVAESLGADPPAIHRILDRLVAACSSAFVRTRARDCKFSKRHRNRATSKLERNDAFPWLPRHLRLNRKDEDATGGKIAQKATDFPSIRQTGCCKVSGFRKNG